MSAYRTLIELTEDAILRRATWFRNHIVAVTLLTGSIVIASVVTQSSLTLAAVVMLIPVSGAFLFADGRLLHAWRARVLATWTSLDIDLAAFRGAVRAHPLLPKDTLEGMLATLPHPGDLVVEQQILAPTRQAIAAARTALHQREADAMILKIVAAGITLAVVLLAVWLGHARLLWGLAVLALLPVAGIWLARRRHHAFEADLMACRSHPDFSESDYEQLEAALPSSNVDSTAPRGAHV